MIRTGNLNDPPDGNDPPFAGGAAPYGLPEKPKSEVVCLYYPDEGVWRPLFPIQMRDEGFAKTVLVTVDCFFVDGSEMTARVLIRREEEGASETIGRRSVEEIEKYFEVKPIFLEADQVNEWFDYHQKDANERVQREKRNSTRRLFISSISAGIVCLVGGVAIEGQRRINHERGEWDKDLQQWLQDCQAAGIDHITVSPFALPVLRQHVERFDGNAIVFRNGDRHYIQKDDDRNVASATLAVDQVREDAVRFRLEQRDSDGNLLSGRRTFFGGSKSERWGHETFTAWRDARLSEGTMVSVQDARVLSAWQRRGIRVNEKGELVLSDGRTIQLVDRHGDWETLDIVCDYFENTDSIFIRLHNYDRKRDKYQRNSATIDSDGAVHEIRDY